MRRQRDRHLDFASAETRRRNGRRIFLHRESHATFVSPLWRLSLRSCGELPYIVACATAVLRDVSRSGRLKRSPEAGFCRICCVSPTQNWGTTVIFVLVVVVGGGGGGVTRVGAWAARVAPLRRRYRPDDARMAPPGAARSSSPGEGSDFPATAETDRRLLQRRRAACSRPAAGVHFQPQRSRADR